ncbi:MAG: ROK family protein [Bacteroidales bacterium]|jgi:glucokinase|nr:ROK family protein [Bacteroidales bacterium]
MVIAIDIGGTFIKIGLVKDGIIIEKTSIKAQANIGIEISLAEVEKIIQSLLSKHSISFNEIKGIGVGFPGLVDSAKMKVLSVNDKYNDAVGFDFVKWGEDAFGAPLFLENDARIALLGEWKHGAGKGKNNIVMLTLGTGVGSAVIIEGKPLIGKHFQAGNLGGHSIINLNGAKCNCGNRGCVEAEASTWRLAELLKSDTRYSGSLIEGEELDFKSLFKFAAEECDLSISVRDHCLNVWAAGVINMIHAYDPELVILGGGIMKSADIIIPFIQEKVDKQAWLPWGKLKVLPSKIPNRSALLGAYYLVTTNLKFNN